MAETKKVVQTASKKSTPKETKTKKELKVMLVRSLAGVRPNQKKTLAALGLKKINQVVVKPDNEAIRGMISTVNHLIKVL